MADRYWVGGTGFWNAANTANWSTATGKSITASCATTTLTVTAGTVVVGDTVWSNNHTSLGTITADLGGGDWTVSIGGTFASQAMSAATVGASAPTAVDSVFFDANSNSGTTAFTVTVSAALCNDFNAPGTSTALDGAMTLAMGSSTLTVSGSWTNQATNFSVTNTAGTLTFNATTTGKTITTNGVTIGVNTTLNGVGGAWTLGSPFNCGANNLTLTNGTFDTSASNHSVTAQAFVSSNSNTRTINLNGSTLTFSVSGTGWNMATSTNATLNAGTSTIELSASTIFFNGGGLTYYNVSFTSTTAAATRTITGANTFTNNLTFGSLASAGFADISIGANQTINGTLTVSGSNGNRRYFVRSDTIGTTRTLTRAAMAATSDVDFRDITMAGAAGTLSGTRLGDCGGNSNITFVAGKTVYWNLAAGGSWNSTAWALSSGGTPADANFPLAQDTAIIENTGLNTGVTISNNSGYNIGNFDASTRTNALTFTTAGAPTWNGNFVWGTGLTTASNVTWTFTNRSTKTLDSAGYTFSTISFTVNAPGGGIQLVTNNLTLGAAQATTLTFGTLDLNNLTLSTGTFSSSNSNTRTIAFGSTGSIVTTTTTAASTVLSMATATNFTFTGTSNISAAMSTTRTFNFGSTAGATASNRLNINLTSGVFVPTFSGSFRQINFTGSTLNPGAVTISCHGFTLASGGTYTSTSFTTVGDGTLTSNGKVISALFVSGSGITTTLQDALTCGVSNISQLTQGTLDLNGFTFTTGVFQSTNSNTRSIAFGSTGSIVLTTTSNTTVLLMSDARNFTFTGTSNISAAMSVNARAFSFGSTAGATTSNRLNINLTSGAFVPTFSGSFRQINFTGSTLNPGAVTISCHGFTLASGGTYTSTNFTTVGDGTLTYTGKSVSTLNVNTAGITTTLASAGQNGTTTLTNGTLDLAGFTLTSTTTAATAAGTKNLTFNGGTLVCSAASATAWNNANPTGFTTTAGTGTGTISMTAATAKTFVGGSSGTTYNCTLNQGGAGTLTITGINIFNDITNTNATASQITFPASVTTFFNNFSLSGSAGNLVSLRSSTGGTRFTLSKSSGTVSVSYLNIQDSDATGGALWLSQTTSGNVDSGNNLGWIFGVEYNVSIVESITAIDSILLSLTRLGAVLESATVSDVAAFQLTANGAISETATVSDVAAFQLTANGAISETATVSDSANSQLTAVGLVLEQAAISDAPENILIRFGGINEQAVQSDNTAFQLTVNGAISETVTVSDSSASQLTAVAAISEQATQSDSAVSQLTAVGLVSESAAQSDAPDAKVTMLTAILEQGAISDVPGNILVRFGSVAEQASLSDSASSQMTAVAAVSETTRINDVLAGALTIPCTILEGSQSIPESTFTLPTGTLFTGSTYFNNTSAGGGLTVVANGTGTGSSGGFNAGGNYVLFSGANTRSITTKALDLRLCNNFSFSIIRGTNTNGGEIPDTGENIVVEYSINGGSSYTTITTILNTAAITAFTTLSYSMPVGAKTSSTIVRWRQVTSSAGSFDNYGIRTFTFDGQNAILVSDSPAARLVRSGAVNEQSTMTDTPAARLIRQGLITESLAASETSAAILIRQGLLSEQATATETTTASLLRNGLISEQAAISDAAASQVLWSAAVSEQASISETLSSLVIYFTSILEQGTASVALTTQMTMVASILEQARSADQAVSDFIIGVVINEALSAEDEATIRFLWELIDDNQIPNWQNASTNQTPGWGNVDTATTPNWQNISNNQSSGWGTINTAAGGNWNNINTSPE